MLENVRRKSMNIMDYQQIFSKCLPPRDVLKPHVFNEKCHTLNAKYLILYPSECFVFNHKQTEV